MLLVNGEQVVNKRWHSSDHGLAIERLPAKESFKSKAYSAIKEAITNMNIYGSEEPLLLDERDISERLGASRTPIREAVAMLEQEGLLRAVPRRGILVVRRTKAEIIEMIEAWAALESMAARLAAQRASDEAIAELRIYFREFDLSRIERDRCDEYSSANIAFHQALIRLSGSTLLAAMTENLFLHVRAIRHRTIFEMDRAQRSAADHLEIIEALEARDMDRAERLVRDHTLRLARHVENHVDLD
ncbi:GntR family transcriptional regulator [Ancylobacter sp. 6x-1]|uniref:GntR family transcriptional regulator n=1 Tax=Ancylobacter crimeensis TaxID=2579147 RepID=A0ABT0DG11_9HYPH|nr:GntR family transcriptional regulator [Ancylobacter crimeensis]MCK0198898.1 GntR family transcriptional regulator [Ancylobacter crimeensis]